MQSPTAISSEPLYSTLGEDPDLRDIVEMFVNEMPERTAALVDRLDVGDWEGLRRLAHQLKGAAGSYGFEPITHLAAGVEHAIRDSRPEPELRQMVGQLTDLCDRARVAPAS